MLHGFGRECFETAPLQRRGVEYVTFIVHVYYWASYVPWNLSRPFHAKYKIFILVVIVFMLLNSFSERAHLLFEQIIFLQNCNWKTQYIWVSYRECLCIVPYFIAFNLLTVVVPGLNIINFLYGTMCCYDFSNIYSDLSCLAIPTKSPSNK